MKNTQITVTTTTMGSELVAYYMQEVCMDGVTIIDKSDLAVGNWDYIDTNVESSYDNNVYVRGYIPTENTNSVLLYLADNFAQLDNELYGSLTINHCEATEVDWVGNWQKNFSAIDFGSIVICPEWIEYSDKSKPILLLDNGASFGTGQHETTSMCIKLLSTLELGGMSILDVGCGSGILALSTLLLGADNATLVDIDKMCTDTAKANAMLNNVNDKCHIVCGNLCDEVEGQFDIVLANLTADILYMLSQDIIATLRHGSKIVLSGILTDRVDKVIKCYQDIGCRLLIQLNDGEWSGLLMEYDHECI